MPAMSGGGYCYLHQSPEVNAKKLKKLVDRQREAVGGGKRGCGVQGGARLADNPKTNKGYANGGIGAKNGLKSAKAKNGEAISKSVLLREADNLVSLFVRNRDANEAGEIVCPCCNRAFNLSDRGADGECVVQALHFVSRKVYSIRWETNQIWAGDMWCNKAQHDNPTGWQYQNYKKFLIDKFGEAVVADWESQKRNINKIELSTIKEVIKKFKP